MGFEPETSQTQGTEPTTGPPHPTSLSTTKHGSCAVNIWSVIFHYTLFIAPFKETLWNFLWSSNTDLSSDYVVLLHGIKTFIWTNALLITVGVSDALEIGCYLHDIVFIYHLL